MTAVSIVIPVGPRHREASGVAVASVLGQRFTDVECVVVNDSGQPLRYHSTDPRLTVIDAPRREGLRPSIARNAGIAVARGTFLINLDADDYLLPDGVGTLLRAHTQHDRCYTYGEHYGMLTDGHVVTDPQGRPRPNGYGVAYDAWDYTAANLHAISALIPLTFVRQVGGFDEGAPGWDDWTLFARLRKAGYCGHYTRQPVFVYRRYLSQQHQIDDAGGEALMSAARARIIGEGWQPMACGCGSAPRSVRGVVTTPEILGGGVMDDNVIVLEYTGTGQGTVTLKGPASGTMYRVGNNATRRYLSTGHNLNPADVQGLLNLGLFRRIPPPPAFAPPPPPVPVEDVQAATISGAPIPGDEDALQDDGNGVMIPTPKRRRRAKDDDGE